MSNHTTKNRIKTQVDSHDNSMNMYIHFPFCDRKCSYCAFYSLTHLEKMIPEYLKAIKKEIWGVQKKYKQKKIRSIFMGGGTPSLVPPKDISDLIAYIKNIFSITYDVEITLEANPETLNLTKLKAYKKGGINRLSLGLQAWQDDLLIALGRTYTHKKFTYIFKAARHAGFTNINIDCMFGLPNQSISDWQDTITHCLELSPEHLACYSLQIEPNTVYGSLSDRGLLLPCDESVDRQMYMYTKKVLLKAGYIHYEISNFCKPLMECRHNLDFWNGYSYLGIGAGAHSFIEGMHSEHAYLSEYLKNPFSIIKESIYKIDTSRKSCLEWLVLRFRLINGFTLNAFETNFGKAMRIKLELILKEMASIHVVKMGKNKVRLSEFGENVLNLVLEHLNKVL